MQDLISRIFELAEFGEYDSLRDDYATINELNDDFTVRLITQTDITVEVVYRSELVLRAVNAFYSDRFVVEHVQPGAWQDFLQEYCA